MAEAVHQLGEGGAGLGGEGGEAAPVWRRSWKRRSVRPAPSPTPLRDCPTSAALRERVDPEWVFGNAFLDRVLGEG